jgi:hypothetical protein
VGHGSQGAAVSTGLASTALTLTTGTAAVAALVSYIFFFNLGLGALPGLVSNEVLPLHARAQVSTSESHR